MPPWMCQPDFEVFKTCREESGEGAAMWGMLCSQVGQAGERVKRT